MLIAKDRLVLLVIDDIQVFCHFFPFVDPTLLYSAPGMATLSAICEVTLNNSSYSSLFTFVASDFTGSRNDLANNFLDLTVFFVPDTW